MKIAEARAIIADLEKRLNDVTHRLYAAESDLEKALEELRHHNLRLACEPTMSMELDEWRKRAIAAEAARDELRRLIDALRSSRE